MRAYLLAPLAGLLLAGCAATQTQQNAELTAAFNVAAAAEAAYAASPGADAKKVAEAARLLAAAQAALFSWTNSSDPADRKLADAAIAALVAYEATLQAAPRH